MNPPRPLPREFELVTTLREEGRQQVLHARGPRGDVVLRLGTGSRRDLELAELAVLAELDVPGLAGLVGFGRLAENDEPWTAREWIPGVELGEWARGRESREIGELVARLCPALSELHARGFVHADLKPENVIVTPEGAAVLTDFGLTRRAGDQAGAGGTLFYVAPEVLLGRPAQPASDLFALGVMLHALLIGERATAREFYARFPAHSFFEASDTAPEDLPEWARAIVAQLLERDPARRPASAAALAANLRTVLGGMREASTERPEDHLLNWSPLAGREAWLAEQLAPAPITSWIELPPGDDPGEALEALRLWLTLRGEVAEAPTPRELASSPEQLVRRMLAATPGGWWLIPVSGPASQRLFGYLARAARQQEQRSTGGAPRLVGLAVAQLEPPVEPSLRESLPPLGTSELVELLEPDFEGDLQQLAGELAEASSGSITRAARILQRALQGGEFVTGQRGFTRRPGARGELLEQARPAVRTFSPQQAQLLAAVEVCGAGASFEELRELSGLEEAGFAAAVTQLCASGDLRWCEGAHETRLVSTRRDDSHGVELVGVERARELHAARSRTLAGEERSLYSFAARADADSAQAVLELIARTQDRGDLPRALELAERFVSLARSFAAPHVARAVGELALAWAALGIPERAEAQLETLEAAEGTAVEAVIARVRGRLAHLRHDYAEAERLLARAAELEPDDGGESLFRTALLLFDTRREQDLAGCLRRARERWSSLAERYRWSLDAIEAMSAVRRGELDEAARHLRAQLEQALGAGDEQREALVRNNLALLERRSGELESAARHLTRAGELQERLGMLPGLAQSRAMLGATRREQGALHEAEALLRSAFELRERLGDTSGALAARGMLGLTHADAGRLREAADELGASVEALERAGRSADAALLAAKLREVRARWSEAPARAFAEEPVSDPRVLLSHARAAALWGDEPRARDLATRAADLAERLALAPLAREIHSLLALLEGEVLRLAEGVSLAAVEREAVLGHLAHTPDAFDAAAALECARRTGFRGRADLAARLAMAVAARCEERPLREEARLMARNWLSVVERGLTGSESERARRTLLGVPDPWPADLDGYEHAETHDDSLDMDIISLLDINHRLVAQDDLPSLLGEIVESAMSVTRAERGFLVLEENGELEFDTARHSRRGDLVEPESEISRSILSKVLESGVTLRLSNATDDPLLGGAPSVAQLELRSILVAPFDIEDGLRGAIYVDHRLREGAFSERAEQLLDLLAGQAALAIRQARRLQEIRELNRQLNHKVVARESDLATARKALKEAGAVVPSSGLVGSSDAMRRVHALIERCASASLAVLVCGPSGSGKELAARALHEESSRKQGPFISENCAALPPSLIESELFGFVKGAFTGADRDRAGLFERAHTGTLFLDEIGELPLELQAKLLRAIETGEIRRVGSSKVRSVDFRLVAATNRDLHAEAALGTFRSDLVYRLDALRIELPALAARTEDIPELVQHFLQLEAARSGGEPREVSPAVLEALMRRAWPGNVRELSNEVARLCVLCEGELDDPGLIRAAAAGAGGRDLFSAAGEVLPLAELERKAIFAALEHTSGDKRRAAELLGISRAKIYQRLKEWGAEVE